MWSTLIPLAMQVVPMLVKGMQGEEKNQLHSGAIKPPFCNTTLTEIQLIKGHEKITTNIVTMTSFTFSSTSCVHALLASA